MNEMATIREGFPEEVRSELNLESASGNRLGRRDVHGVG